MATIVRQIRKNKRFILLGTGFGAFQSKKPNWLLGDLVADTSQGQYTMACVCDKNGQLYWIESAELTVESVDGEAPDSLLE